MEMISITGIYFSPLAYNYSNITIAMLGNIYMKLIIEFCDVYLVYTVCMHSKIINP